MFMYLEVGKGGGRRGWCVLGVGKRDRPILIIDKRGKCSTESYCEMWKFVFKDCKHFMQKYAPINTSLSILEQVNLKISVINEIQYPQLLT